MADPHNSVHTCIADAKSFGTFRATVNCSPSSIETDGQVFSIDECWLEQWLVMDFLYSPWRDTEVVFVCFNSKMCLEPGSDYWPSLYHASRPNSFARVGDR